MTWQERPNFRQERRRRARELRQRGHTTRQIAQTFARDYHESPLKAFRWAHDWSLVEACERFNNDLADDPEHGVMSPPRLSLYENWPRSANPECRPPGVRLLQAFARLYQSAPGDLIEGADYTPEAEQHGSTPAPATPSQEGPGESARRPTLLRVLVRRRHWQTYETFVTQYERAGKELAERDQDPRLRSLSVQRRQYERWLSGRVKTMPYPSHCRVLEYMFGCPVSELLSPAPPEPESVGRGQVEAVVPPVPVAPGADRASATSGMWSMQDVTPREAMPDAATVGNGMVLVSMLVGEHSLLRGMYRADPAAAHALLARAVASQGLFGSLGQAAGVGWQQTARACGESSPMNRRAAILYTLTLLGAPVIEALSGLPDKELIAALRATTSRYRSELATTPARTLHPGIRRHASELDRLAKPAAEPLRAEVLGVLGETLELAGRVAWFDLAKPVDATRHLEGAVAAATTAGDASLAVWVMSQVALRAQFEQRPAEALDCLRQAADQHVTQPASFMAACLLKEQAVNSALLGDERGALATLEGAYRAREDADVAVQPPLWAADVARLEATAGYVLTLLGRAEAPETIRSAIEATPPASGLRATLLAALAESYAQGGELHAAVDAVVSSLVIAVQLASHERKRRLPRPYGMLRRQWQDEPAVLALGSQLRAAGLAA